MVINHTDSAASTSDIFTGVSTRAVSTALCFLALLIGETLTDGNQLTADAQLRVAREAG